MFDRVMTLQEWIDDPTFQFADTRGPDGELDFQYRFSYEPRRGWRWRRGVWNARYKDGHQDYRVHVWDKAVFLAQLQEEGVDLSRPVTETTMW